MAQTARVGLLVGGAVLLVAAGGAAALLVTRQASAPPSGTAPAVVSSTTPPPASTASAPPAAPPAAASAGPTDAGSTAADADTMPFDSSQERYSLARDSAAYVAASMDAPQLYPLRAGTALKSAAASRDGKWVVATTADGQAAYLPRADLGPYDPSRVPAEELPAHVEGKASVVDTATLTIDGQTVHLSGLIGKQGEYASKMQEMIDSQGASVQCDLVTQAYLCKLPGGDDVGRFVLYNGGADITTDASRDYQAQAEAARTAHRGIWKAP